MKELQGACRRNGKVRAPGACRGQARREEARDAGASWPTSNVACTRQPPCALRVAGGFRCLSWRGEGSEPLLLLHGFTGHPLAWKEVVEALHDPGLVLAPFLPGHGPGGNRHDAAGFEQAVHALIGAVRTVDPGPWRVAGYSLGARVALGMLAAAPSLWSAATLVGVNPGIEREEERLARLDEDAARARLLREEGIESFVAGWERLPLFASQGSVAPARAATQRAWRLGHEADGLARSLETMGLGAMPDYWPALAGVAQPVQLVVGELDSRFRSIAVRAAGMLPAGRLVVVPGVGHNVVLEAPELVARLLQSGTAARSAGREEGA